MLTWQNPAKRSCKSNCDVKQICLDLEEFHGGAPWSAHKQKKVAGDSSELRESLKESFKFCWSCVLGSLLPS